MKHSNGTTPTEGVIFEEKGKFYFWDETWSEKHGGFKTREECVRKLKKYCKEILGY